MRNEAENAEILQREIGQRIKNLREEKKHKDGHCTQEDLGKAMGVSGDQIRKWEKGRIYIGSEKIVALATYFGVSCDFLLRGSKTKNLMLMNQTGLSDESIDILTEMKADYFDPGLSIFVLNTLIKERKILSLLGHYFIQDFDKVTYINNGQPEKIATERLGIFDAFLAESDLEPLARTVISNQIRKLREDVRNGKYKQAE